MKIFDENVARKVATAIAVGNNESFLIDSFVEVCRFLSQNQSGLSWRGDNKPSVFTQEGLNKLAERYFAGCRRSDLPVEPSTIPDEMVSVIMSEFYGYSDSELERIFVFYTID